MTSGYWTTCTIVCWLLAAVAGVLVCLLALDPTSFIAALLVGTALAVFLGLVMTSLFCKTDAPVSASSGAHATAADTSEADAAAAAKAAEDKAAAEKAAADKAAAEKAEQEKAAAEKAAAAKAAEENAAAEKAAADAASTPDYDQDGVREGTNEGTRPAALCGRKRGRGR